MVVFDLGRALAPSWAPLVAAVILLLALLLLWFSMRRHLKRAARFSTEDGVDAGGDDSVDAGEAVTPADGTPGRS